MGTAYKQLSLEDRCQIARLHQDGCSIRKIAASLDRAPSTIARELKRNTGRKIGYKPAYASEQTKARRWKGSKLERQPQLRQAVLARLTEGWSPEQIAGRMARDDKKLLLAALSAARKKQTRLARAARRKPCQLHRKARFH